MHFLYVFCNMHWWWPIFGKKDSICCSLCEFSSFCKASYWAVWNHAHKLPDSVSAVYSTNLSVHAIILFAEARKSKHLLFEQYFFYVCLETASENPSKLPCCTGMCCYGKIHIRLVHIWFHSMYKQWRFSANTLSKFWNAKHTLTRSIRSLQESSNV